MSFVPDPLNRSQVVHYLLQKGLLKAKDICDSDLLLIDASRRNSNIKVIRKNGPSYLVKQCRTSSAIETLANEAAIYSLLGTNARYSALADYLPRCHLYDSDAGLLVLELLDHNAKDLEQYYSHGRFSKTIARKLARALAQLHQAPKPSVPYKYSGAEFPLYELPWAFTLHRPSLGQLRELSSATIQAVGIIQRHRDFHDLIDRCADYWKPDALIHGDIKWANFVIFSPLGSGRKARLKIIDWECSGIGDPCWDVGSVFSAYLSLWVLSMPMLTNTHPDAQGDLCRFPLAAMQPAIRTFWAEYARCMSLDIQQREIFLWRSTLYSAIRLIQGCVERTQVTNVMSKNIVCLLQFAMNTLIQPVETIVRALAIDLRAELGTIRANDSLEMQRQDSK